MKKKIFRGHLSFDKASLRMGATGINMPIPTDFKSYQSSFDPPAKNYLQFGWMGNEPNFYEGVSANDAVPKPEDYIEVPFRLISATTVGAGTWKATDFSNAELLKNSRGFLEGKGVYKDHETDVNNWVGIIKQVKWTESFTQSDGTLVPAGIDGLLAIDTKVDIKLARGIMAGAIYSNSVTVEFEWIMSHEFSSESDFFNSIGKMGADGKMVRRVVTKILNYHETSLVWLGADPFAKSINPDGSLKNIDISNVLSYAKSKLGEDKVTFETEPEEKKTFYTNSKNYEINFGIDENVLSLAKDTGKKTIINNSKDMNKHLLMLLNATVNKHGLQLAKKPEEMTDDEAVAFLQGLTPLSATDTARLAKLSKVEGAAIAFLKTSDPTATTVDMEAFLKDNSFVKNTELQTLQEASKFVGDFKTAFEAKEGDKLETILSSAKENAAIGVQSLVAKQNEVVRLYELNVGKENADPKVIDMYKKADNATIDGLLKQFTKGVAEKFKATCKDCNSHNISLQSSALNTEEPATVSAHKVITNTDIYLEQSQSSMFGYGVKEEPKK